MKRKAQRIRLGIFIMIGSAFLLLILGLFTAKSLFEKKEVYYVSFRDISVSGLEPGSPVKYLGINVGSISRISIDPEDVSTIIVKLSLVPGTPVKEDAVADIVAIGITGLKTIEIRGGSQEAGFLEPEKFISSGSTIAADITGRAEVIAFKVEEILNNLQVFTKPENIGNFTDAAGKISDLAENAGNTLMKVDEIIAENRQDIRNTSASLSNIAGTLDLTAVNLARSTERFNEIMQGEDIGAVLGNLREISLSMKEANLKELIEALAAATMQTQGLLLKLDSDFDESSRQLNDNLVLLQYTLENLNEASRKINTNPSVLIRGQSSRNTPDSELK